jgi:hypothetical protein
MNEGETMDFNGEQEQEITEILTGSSLFLDMHPAERERMLDYIVSSYFNALPNENSRTCEPAVKKPLS